MSDSERKSKVCAISAIWSDAMLDGEPARVSVVNGVARIRIGWFDIHVPGKFDGCADEVISAYKRQEEALDKAFANLPDEPEQPSYCDDLLAISEKELDEQIREFESQCKVIGMKTR